MMKHHVIAVAVALACTMAGCQQQRQQSDSATPLPAATQTFTSPMLSERLVYIGGNYTREDQAAASIENIRKAAAAGYTGIIITDCKFSRWDDKATMLRPAYDNNVKKIRQLCRDLKMKFIVVAMDFGSEMMCADVNLAEGMPVKDAPFVVKAGQLVPADEDFKPANLSFEDSAAPNQPAGWTVDDPGKCAFLDSGVKYDGKVSLRLEDIKAKSAKGFARCYQQVKVKPFRYYHLSAMVKTQDFDAPGTFNIMVIGKTNGLVHQALAVKPTQDWTRVDIVFNTLDNDSVTLYLGSWGGKGGTLWLDDIKVDAGGFVNLIRRPSLTFKISGEDGATVYDEGKDVAKVVDPKLLNCGFLGCHNYWYEQPKVTIPAGSRLVDGQKVLVSYSHAMNVLGWAVCACMNEPRTWELAGRNLKNIHEVMEPDGYMLPHDELRHQGWDESCQKSGKTMCQTLADSVKTCVGLIRKEDPGKPIYAWSDMFDPNHNAGRDCDYHWEPFPNFGQKGYYFLVKGKDAWYGSWEGMDKNIIIINWMSLPEHRAGSLAHFSGLGYKQILAGYYDAPSEGMAPWIADAAKVPGVIGVMYTTWANDYKELGKYLKACGDVCDKPAK